MYFKISASPFPRNATETAVPAVNDWFCRREAVSEHDHQHLERAAEMRKCFADQRHSEAPQYQLGDRVWLATQDIRAILKCKKLSPSYVGPYKIIKRINPVMYRLE